MKRRIQSWLGRLDLDVHRRHQVPFGVRWVDDFRSLLGDQAPRPMLIDVGANIGQTAQSLAATFPAATIYSFEPVPTVFAQLERNTANLPGVECVKLALGDRAGETSITTDRDGQNTLVAGVPSGGSTTTRLDTLDQFSADREIASIQLLKIDTEGFETSVLRGAQRLLSRGCVDFVLAECDFFRRLEEPHGDFFAIHDMLAAHGFRVVGFYSGGVDDQGWVWGDVLMMRQGVVDPMPVVCSPHAD